MLKLLKNLFKKEEENVKNDNSKTTNIETETTDAKTTDNACRKIEFYDKFIVVKNEKDNIIEATIETYSYEYEPEVEELTGKGEITIDLPKCIIRVSLIDDENINKETIGEIVITNILVRNEDIQFKIKVYTTEGQKAIATKPTDLVVDRFKLNIMQK